MTEEEFHKQLERGAVHIGLLPPCYQQLTSDLKLFLMVTRAGWSVNEALKLLDVDLTIPNKESLQSVHEIAAQLQKEVEELFWRTHLSAWRDN